MYRIIIKLITLVVINIDLKALNLIKPSSGFYI